MSSTKVRSERNRQRQRHSVFWRAQDRVDAPHLGKPWLNQKSDRKLPMRHAAVPAGFSHARVGCGSLQKGAVQFQASWHDCLQNAGANAEWLRQSRCRRAPEELLAWSPIFPDGRRVVSPASIFRSPRNLRMWSAAWPRFCGKEELLSNTPFSPCSACVRGGSLTPWRRRWPRISFQY